MSNIIYPGGTAVQGIIMQDPKTGTLWKLLMGDTFMAGWTGPQYPNRSTMADTCFGDGAQFNFSDPACLAHCGRGCLYDPLLDPRNPCLLSPCLGPPIDRSIDRRMRVPCKGSWYPLKDHEG